MVAVLAAKQTRNSAHRLLHSIISSPPRSVFTIRARLFVTVGGVNPDTLSFDR